LSWQYTSFFQIGKLAPCLFDFSRWGLYGLLHEMMEKYKTAFMPRDKKYTVTNRAQIPQVAALACHDKNKSGASRSSSLYYALKVIG